MIPTNSISLEYREMHNSALYRNINILGTSFNLLLAAMSNKNYNTVTGQLVEHRGLHWNDKRFGALTGIEFVGGHPRCSYFKLNMHKKEAAIANRGRSAKAKKISDSDYFNSLLIRWFRGVIQNPVLRFDLGKRLCEKLRSVNQKFVKFAMKPQNAQAAASMILFN